MTPRAAGVAIGADMPPPPSLDASALAPLLQRLGDLLRDRGWQLATAESCTGGLIAAACTSLAGSSDWYARGWITYSNVAKEQDLGVPPEVIQSRGAVSREVVRRMAEGAAARAGAPVAVAVSGIAGPGGGSRDKPVGTVWIAWCLPGRPVQARCLHLHGDRGAIRAAAVHAILSILVEQLSESPSSRALP